MLRLVLLQTETWKLNYQRRYIKLSTCDIHRPAAKDNPETDFYENPIEKPAQIPEDDKANEDPA